MRHLPRVYSAGLAALVWVALAPLAALPQADIRVDVRLVRIITTTIRRTDGRLVGSLTKEDFTVFDNNVQQQIAAFERGTNEPLSVSLLIDISGSTAKDLKYEVESVSKFLHALFSEGNPTDAASLYSFNYQVVKNNHFTRNTQSLERSLKSLKGEAGTSLYDAIYLASQEMEQRDGRSDSRKDGCSHNPRHTAA